MLDVCVMMDQLSKKLHDLGINQKPGVFENKIHDWELKPYSEDKA